jgi:hypothetical protein
MIKGLARSRYGVSSMWVLVIRPMIAPLVSISRSGRPRVRQRVRSAAIEASPER